MRSPTCAVTVCRSEAIVTTTAPGGADGEGDGVVPEPATPSDAAAGGDGAAISSATPPTLLVTVEDATYGRLIIDTVPGALCGATVQLPSGGTVLASAFFNDHEADADGRVTWSYTTPVAGAGTGSGHYRVHCALAAQSAEASRGFVVP